MLFVFIYYVVVVGIAFFGAFALATHVLWSKAESDRLQAEYRPDVALKQLPSASDAELEASATQKAAMHPDVRLPPAVLIRRRWNMPPAVSKELCEYEHSALALGCLLAC